MSEMPGGAATFARGRAEWSRLDWWRLEARAFAQHPDVRHALTFDAPVGAWRELGRPTREVPRWAGVLLLPVWIASLTLPVVTTVLLLRWLTDGDAVVDLTLAGALTGGAAVVLTLGVLQDLRDAEGPASHGLRPIGVAHLAPSALAGVLALLAIAQGRADSPYGLIGLLVDAALGAGVLWLHSGTPRASLRRKRTKRRRLARALAALSTAERAAIGHDIASALDDLAARGLIDREVATAARALPLGALGRTLADRDEITALRCGR
ncbi:hypothetical protein FHP29_19930 [Nocardioides albidus]|uniref:DUF2637 domain-containing protein n=1 Tax=Nocardioides albidus TaxID=1517589 RepID=A0A5C4VKL2_9ACTN|nr:hypothetical protein [Nocardioides albidus]TNM36414.1 hypothetical protein FHP29_19930 [Nocardioides albidus]